MVFFFFFASGLTALAYQVVWTRSAGLALGNAPAAVGTVVAVFMGGLALGSAWAGRVASRVRPLRLYGQIEIAVGLFALAVPWLFRAAAPLLAAAYDTPLFGAAGVLACAVLLFPATFLMGATLPLLAQHVDRKDGAGKLYAVNSAGAALGALAAGLFLLPRIGQAATTGLAAAVNVAVGLAAMKLGGRAPSPPAVRPPPAPLQRPQKTALQVYALSGFAALVCEIAWTRALVLSLGSTVYAFALILFAFILGLALGSALAARKAAYLRDPLQAAGVLQILVAAWGAGLVWILGDLPERIQDVILLFRDDFLLLQLAEAGIVLGLLLPPTTLMGALLPVALAVFRQEGGEAGRSVGRLYAFNTAAAIAGTLAATFLLVPCLGTDLTLRLAAGVNVAAALAAIWLGSPAKARRRFALTGASATAGLAAVFVPRWDLEAASSGNYLYASARELDEVAGHEIEGTYWDAFGLVTVHRTRSGRFLRINGKTDASWGSEDTPTQALIAQIPMILHPEPRDVLVIGLGSGITLANAQTHDPASVECVEISPAVVRAAGHFSGVNGDACARPGTRLVVGDARTHVRYGGGAFDVIASEPSNLWVSGMAGLFTVDFFREVRARLKPGGIFAQWVHAYRLSPRDFQGVMRTFVEVFPRASLWEMNPQGDYLLIGTAEERKWRIGEIARRIGLPAVARNLSEIGIDDVFHFLAGYTMGPGELAALAGKVPRMTDDDCWVEYAAPVSMLRANLPGVIALMESARRNAREMLEDSGLDEASARRLDRFAESRRRLCRALLSAGGKAPGTFGPAMDAILRINPEDSLARRYAEREGKAAYQRAFAFQAAGQMEAALAELDGVPARSDPHADALVLQGWIMVRLGRIEDAQERYREALRAYPRTVEAQVGLAQVAEAQGRAEEARAMIEEAIHWDPRSAVARVAHARFLWRRGEKDRARDEVERALRDNPGNAAALELRKGFKSD